MGVKRFGQVSQKTRIQTGLTSLPENTQPISY
jgi:hypothetical protein